MGKRSLTNTSTEAILLAFQQHRSPEIWGEIYGRYYERVVRLCYKMGLQREDALDMGQEVMLKVYGQLHTLKRLGAFESWLFRITHNTCINYLKKKKKHATRPIDNLPLSQRLETTTDLLDKESTLQEKYQSITNIMAGLPPETRRLVQMKYLEDYPIKELGKIFNLKESAVKMRLSRARRKMRQAYLYPSAMTG